MKSFALTFADLALAIKEDDLDRVIENMAIIEEHYNVREVPVETYDDLSYVTVTDVHALDQDNDSYIYFLTHFKPADINTYKALWDALSRIMNGRRIRDEISGDEFNEFLESIYEDVDSPIREYRYNNLIRLALIDQNYPFIIKVKQQMEDWSEA